jgi:hypothetical protein
LPREALQPVRRTDRVRRVSVVFMGYLPRRG